MEARHLHPHAPSVLTAFVPIVGLRVSYYVYLGPDYTDPVHGNRFVYGTVESETHDQVLVRLDDGGSATRKRADVSVEDMKRYHHRARVLHGTLFGIDFAALTAELEAKEAPKGAPGVTIEMSDADVSVLAETGEIRVGDVSIIVGPEGVTQPAAPAPLGEDPKA